MARRARRKLENKSRVGVSTLSSLTGKVFSMIGRHCFCRMGRGAPVGGELEAWITVGDPVVEKVGDLVIAAPIPSMSGTFWHDPWHR